MNEKILIYEKKLRAKKFLRSFFEKRQEAFDADFADDIAGLRRKLAKNKMNNPVCLVSIEGLEGLRPHSLGCPVLATISSNSRTDIKEAIRHGVENYISMPFCEEDLEYKLKSALAKKQMLEHLRKEAANLQAINELTYLTSSTLDPQEILYLTVKKISEVIPVNRCSIIRVDARKRYAYVAATYEDPKLRNIKLDLKKYPEIRKGLMSKEPIVINDINTDPVMEEVRDIISPLGILSIVVIPIVLHEEIIGTLFLRTSRAKNAFNANEITLCNAIANASAHSLYNAFIFERVENEKARFEKAAVTDYLTGIYNIRYFNKRLSEEFNRSERHGLSMSCLMLDIDNFKKINDRFGHKIGDIILRELAQLLKKLTRKSDILARYGGEEFIVLLTDASLDDAASKAENLRAYIEKHKFQGAKDRKNLTVSIGVSSYPGYNIKNTDELITCADDALYSAKKSGRNRVVAYSPKK